MAWVLGYRPEFFRAYFLILCFSLCGLLAHCGGVNAYGQPDHKISVFYDFPMQGGMLYGQYTSSDLQLIFETWSFVAVKGYSYFFTATLLWEAISFWDAISRFAEQTLSWRSLAAVHHHHHLQVKCQVSLSLFAIFFHLLGITFLWGLLFFVY